MTGGGARPPRRPQRVLVTGASGFVGRRVCVALAAAGWEVVAAVRDERARTRVPEAAAFVLHGDLGRPFEWAAALRGVHAVVHAAARVHVMRDAAADPLAAFRGTNVDVTARIAAAALAAGAERFVYLSSIKAMGDGGPHPYREEDPPEPGDPYGLSKLEAERRLGELTDGTGLAAVALRPPLVYGPEVGGNFARLLRLADVAQRVPLPLGGVANRRSLVYVDNLASAVTACVVADPAPRGVFLVSDGEDLSTAELLARLARAGGGRARLVPVPTAPLRWAARIAGRGADAERLLGSLQVDSGRIRHALGWTPPVSVDEALRATVAWYHGSRGA